MTCSWSATSLTCTTMRRSSLIVVTFIASALLSCSRSGVRAVRSYIAEAWDSTLRYQPSDTPDSLIGMPYPYTVPCAAGMFNELYYWDTFFTNEGLIADGRVCEARDNTSDLLSLVERYGFVPNGNRLWYLTRSQPPYLARMVERVFASTRDTTFLAGAFPLLEKEYSFWMTERLAPCGLNRYGSTGPDEDLIEEFITTASRRIGKDVRTLGWDAHRLRKFGLDCIAECESGWDFNPRFDRRCGDFCPVDLNANLYGMETLMAEFATVLGLEKEAWEERAKVRRNLILQYCYDNDRNGWFDYDYVNDSRSDVVSAAVFSLLFNRVLSDEEAASVKATLNVLEFAGGLSVCEDKEYPYPYQWSYPNAWPPTTYVAVEGLLHYGFRDDAFRLARKYIESNTRAFGATGQLWEKIDCRTGDLPVDREYGTPAMLGWTAGAYVCFDELLKRK